jgi:hypothetical protein
MTFVRGGKSSPKMIGQKSLALRPSRRGNLAVLVGVRSEEISEILKSAR